MLTQALNAASKKLDKKRQKYSASIKARADRLTSKSSEKLQTGPRDPSRPSSRVSSILQQQSSQGGALPSPLPTTSDSSHASSTVSMSDTSVPSLPSPLLSEPVSTPSPPSKSSLITTSAPSPAAPDVAENIYAKSFGSLGFDQGYASSSSSSLTTDAGGSPFPTSSNRSSMSSTRSFSDCISSGSRSWNKRDSGYESSSTRSSGYFPAFKGHSRNDSGFCPSQDSLPLTPATSVASSPISISTSPSSEGPSPNSSYHRRRGSNPSRRNSLLESFSSPPVASSMAVHNGISRMGSPLSTICADPEENVLPSSLKSGGELPVSKIDDMPCAVNVHQEPGQTTTGGLDLAKNPVVGDTSMSVQEQDSKGCDHSSSSLQTEEIDSMSSHEKLVSKDMPSQSTFNIIDQDDNKSDPHTDLNAGANRRLCPKSISGEIEDLSRQLGSLLIERSATQASDDVTATNIDVESQSHHEDDAGASGRQGPSSERGTRHHSSGHDSSGSQGYYSGIGGSDQSFGGFGDQYIPGDGETPAGDGDGDDESEGRKGSRSPDPSTPSKPKKQDLQRCPWPGCPWSKATHLKTHLRRKHFKPLKCPKNGCTQRFGDCWGIERHIKDRHREMDPKTAGVPQSQSEVNHFQNRLINTTSTFTYQEQVAICKAKTRQQLMAISHQIRGRPELSDEAVEEWRNIVRRSRETQRPQPALGSQAQPFITLPSPGCSTNKQRTLTIPDVHTEAYSIMRELPEVSDVQASDSSRIVTAVKQIIENSNFDMADSDAKTLHALDSLRRAFDFMSLNLSETARAQAAHTGSLQPLIISPSIPSLESPNLTAVTDTSSPPLQGWEDYEGLLPQQTAGTPSDSAYTSGSDPMIVEQNPPSMSYRYPRRPSVRVMAHQYSVAHALPPPPPLITPTSPTTQTGGPRNTRRHTVLYTNEHTGLYDNLGYNLNAY